MKKSCVSILIEDLKIQTIIGVLESERKSPQTLIINAKLDYFYQKEYLDYTKIVDFLMTTIQNQKYGLLEDAIEDLAQKLSVAFPTLARFSIKLQKPDILSSCVIGIQQEINL